MKVSLAVATLGRPTLEDCIESWLIQTHPIDQIIIVADGRAAGENVQEMLKKYKANSDKFQLIVNDVNLGASASFNIAKSHARNELIALTSDDDPWVPNKLELQKSILEIEKLDLVLTGCYYKRKSKLIKRPRKVINPDTDPLLDVLKHRTLPWTSSKYLPMSSILFRKEINKINFDETLKGYEDFWWLHEVFVSGFKIKQVSEPLIFVNVNLFRTNERITQVEALFSEKLNKLNPFLAKRFLASHLIRSEIYSGNIINVARLHFASLRFKKDNVLDVLEFSWQLIATVLIFISKKLRKLSWIS